MYPALPLPATSSLQTWDVQDHPPLEQAAVHLLAGAHAHSPPGSGTPSDATLGVYPGLRTCYFLWGDCLSLTSPPGNFLLFPQPSKKEVPMSS